MINLYVDDLRDCPDDFVIARTFEEALEFLHRCEIKILSLDHDLGFNEHGEERRNGYDIVKYFCENQLSAKKIFLHTDNPVGRTNMFETLIAAQRRGFINKDIEVYRYPYISNRYTAGEKFES